MSDLLSVAWENSADTPLSANNLSRIVEHYSEGSMLFVDSNDNTLKLRANSKIGMPIPQTNAFFSFDDTFSSHDSKYYPTTASNITFRIESTTNSKSIAIESATENLLSNPQFDTNLLQWTTSTSGSSIVTTSTAQHLFGARSASISIDSTGNQASLSQTISISGSTASLSFYYKSSSANLKIAIVGDSNKYWKWNGVLKNWEPLLSSAEVALPSSTEWTRIEIKDIYITGTSTLEVRFYSNEPSSTYWIDGAQIEYKDFCSSFTPSNREAPVLQYATDILRTEQGLIDLIYTPKKQNASNIIFIAQTSSEDAIRLVLNSSNNIVFSMYNTLSASYVETALNISSVITDQAFRIICNWNKNTGIYLNVNGATSVLNLPFTPYNDSAITNFYIGGRFDNASVNLAEGLIDSFKSNIYSQSITEIEKSLVEDPKPNDNVHLIYSVGNKNIVVDKTLLDSGSDLVANTNYYIWMFGDIASDVGGLCISTRSDFPIGHYKKNCKAIGGFRVDSSLNVLKNYIWDVGTTVDNITIKDRVVHINPATNLHNIVLKNNSNGTSDFEINTPTTFNSQVRITSDFIVDNGLNIASGVFSSDGIQIEGDTISGDTINISTVSLDIIGITDITGDTTVNNVILTDNRISTEVGYDLNIQSATGRDVILNPSVNVSIPTGKKISFSTTEEEKIIVGATNAIGINSSGLSLKSNQFTFTRDGVTNPLAVLTYGNTSAVIDDTSRLYAGRVYNPVFADLAECWVKSENLEFGQVAVQTKDGVRPSRKRAEKATVGVVSNTYGYLLNSKSLTENLEKSPVVPIAISGRVLVKSIGSLEIGDELVSYNDGVAIKANIFEKIFLRDRIIGMVDSIDNSVSCWVKV